MTLRIAVLDVRDAAPLIATWATPDDRAHSANRPLHKAQESLAARAALRCLVSRITGTQIWQLQINSYGKPTLLPNGTALPPAISLSHSGGIVAVVTAPPGAALGIDIEKHKPRDFCAIAAHAFGPIERTHVAADGIETFYRIWTAREARAKAIGGGFAAVLDDGDRVGPGISGGNWHWEELHFQHSFPREAYSLTVAYDRPATAHFETLIR